MNVALMGSDKGIQVFALIGLFAKALAGCTSSEASDPPAIDQTIPGATNQARNWINNTDLSLEQIEQRAQTEAVAAPAR